jgi:hypothetical protein
MLNPLFWGFFIKRIFIYDMLKRIPKSDISIRPFKAYKEWNEVSSEASVLIAEEGSYSDTQMIDISVGHLSGSTYNKHSVYGQIKSAFYNGREDNPIQRYGIKTSGFTIFTKAKERYLSGSATVISIPEKCVGEGIKRGSVILSDDTTTYSDDGFGNLSGNIIDVELEIVNFDNEQITIQDLTNVLISFKITQLNLETNILVVEYNSIVYTLQLIKIDFENDILEVDEIPFLNGIINQLGNIFYAQGLIVLTEAENFNTSSFNLYYKSTETVYEHEYLLIVNEDEFGVSQNPSAVIEVGRESERYITSDGKTMSVITNPGVKYIRKKSILETGDILDYRFTSQVNSNVKAGFEHWDLSGSVDSTGSFLTPFITTIGLYDDNCDLVAVAKLPQPIKSEPDIPVNFIIRFDT